MGARPADFVAGSPNGIAKRVPGGGKCKFDAAASPSVQLRSRSPWFSTENKIELVPPAATVPPSVFGLTTICGAPTLTVTVSPAVNICGVAGVHLMPELSVTDA